MPFSLDRGLSGPRPRKDLSLEEAKATILKACDSSTSYRGIDALLRAVNEADRERNLSRQIARAALTELREEKKISSSDTDIRLVE